MGSPAQLSPTYLHSIAIIVSSNRGRPVFSVSMSGRGFESQCGQIVAVKYTPVFTSEQSQGQGSGSTKHNNTDTMYYNAIQYYQALLISTFDPQTRLGCCRDHFVLSHH